MSDGAAQSHPPRLYGLVATEAPIALIFRRGPSDWFHLLKWHLDDGSLEPGVWVKKKLYPRRCDLSPDGRLMCFYLSGGFDGDYQVLAGVSRVPWLHPLDSWHEAGTWGRGWTFQACFVQAGDYARDVRLDGRRMAVVRMNDAVSFLNERRRGWMESADCPPRDSTDAWDEKRRVTLEKCGPSELRLTLTDNGYVTEGGIDGHAPSYALVARSGQSVPLPDASWADWCPRGRLLVATRSGMLLMQEACDGRLRTLVEHVLTGLKPDPKPAPEWATLLLE